MEFWRGARENSLSGLGVARRYGERNKWGAFPARHGVLACRRGIPVRHDTDPVFRGFLRPSGIAKARNSRMVAAMCEIMAQMGRYDGKLPLEIRKDRVYYDCDDRVTCRSRSGDRKPCPPPLAPRSDALRTLRNNYRQTQVTSNISRRIRGGSLCFKLTTRDGRGVFFFRVAAVCMRFRRSAATVACIRVNNLVHVCLRTLQAILCHVSLLLRRLILPHA